MFWFVHANLAGRAGFCITSQTGLILAGRDMAEVLPRLDVAHRNLAPEGGNGR